MHHDMLVASDSGMLPPAGACTCLMSYSSLAVSQVSYYFRPDRCVVTFTGLAARGHSANSTIQIELFWKAGTLAPGSVRLTWLHGTVGETFAGLTLAGHHAPGVGGDLESLVAPCASQTALYSRMGSWASPWHCTQHPHDGMHFA